ncbi:pantothenate kinase [Demequina sediminis]|jgi:type I pantothenate kinase|uniref:Pantothenate kinase n=1 Tax=Demequina sediminis TaxID=1930058 RepID=A0ABP9WGG3_9MICO|nr:type I pantothenate kinase [Demequina sediminis]
MRNNGRVNEARGSDAGTPYVTLGRDEWAALADATPLPLTEADIAKVRGLGDPVDLAEVDQIYRPLSRLLDLYSGATGALHRATSQFLGERASRTPFVIGVAGSVAVGKSTTARLLKELMARWPRSPRVELVTTDGFLYPNSVLIERDLLARKGFPESYDRRALRNFILQVKSGASEVRAPVYSHQVYDIVPDQQVVVRQPDVLIVEGLNVLQTAQSREPGASQIAVSDFFDVSIYVDADPDDIRRWYIERFLALRESAFARPDSYFHSYSTLTDTQAKAVAGQVWDTVNAPNLARNIAPTRSRATIILRKGADHTVESVRLRKL